MEAADTLPIDGSLDGYQKKKYDMKCFRLWHPVLRDLWNRYVAKIIFTYILGYKVDVGHMEAVNLISSPKYSEKQIVCTPFAINYFPWFRNPPSKPTAPQGIKLTRKNLCIKGILGGNLVDARKLRPAQIGSQLDPERPG